MNEPKRYIIIGGVAAGATAAARLRRQDEKASIIVLERGPYVSYANCGLPYYISGDIKRRSRLLLQSPEGFFSRYRVEVRLKTEAVEIDRTAKRVRVAGPAGEEWLPYDKLLLAQGGRPVIPDLPGVERSHVFPLWTVPDMDKIDEFLKKNQPKKAVVAGGGFIGLEMAEALHARGLEVDLVELAPQLMVTMDPEFGELIKRELEEKGVRVHLNAGLSSVNDGSVTLSTGSSLDTDLVILSIGVRPELTLARDSGLALGESGGLAVDEFMKTSDPYIYAAGDMVEIVNKVSGKKVRIPLAGPANRQGRIAAQNMNGGKVPYRGGLGTSVVKVMSKTAGGSGLTEKACRQLGLDYGVSFIVKDHHVSYYPGSEPILLKLVFSKKDGRVLGVQAFGTHGVDKRIDVGATAILGKMTLEDLSELDLAYAPPYGSGHDPVNMAAYVGLNSLNGYTSLVTASRALEDRKAGALILDVRTFNETSGGFLKDSLLIPGDEVRDRLSEIPRDRAIRILSKDGFLGHVVGLVLRQQGWDDVAFITGGWYALALEPIAESDLIKE